MKISICENEGPYYEIDHVNRYDPTANITQEFYRNYKRITSEFWDIQKTLAKMHYDNLGNPTGGK